jgi:predicted Zn-dependent protease with MMP-like domain
MKSPPVAGLLLMSLLAGVALPDGYWPESKSNEILAKTQTVRLAPDLSTLTAGEAAALKELLEVGAIFQHLYEDARHPQALAAHRELAALDARLGHPVATQNLLSLYRLNHGPIAVTLDNAREPFLPVERQVPGRNVYPAGITRAEVDAFLSAHPDARRSILHERTIVRRATTENITRDRRTLANGTLSTLHPRFAGELEALGRSPDPKRLYAVPYAVAHAEPLTRAHRHLTAAADAVERDDEELAGYLRNRGRDLLTNDYESGDASWVTGRFKHLNAQIGAYETYDDALFGVKAFPAVSLLLADEQATAELRRRLGALQAIEDALPHEHHKRVREDISVGVYDIVADFGQARGTNTATILPNDPLFARRYGRTILMRRNILENPDLFAGDLRVWRAAMEAAHAEDLVSQGDFQRTVWHEVGHYLGVDRDRQGRTLDAALEQHADAVEEMKADLVSLFAIDAMRTAGTVTPAMLKAVQAAGIRRVLLNVKPRRDQPYQTMQLAQFNYFLENGLLAFDGTSGRLEVRYGRYAEVVTALLREVLSIQHAGDKEAAGRFFDRWGAWTPDVHERLASRIREAQGPRFRLVRYAALGE